MDGETEHVSNDKRNSDRAWPYLLAGYVVGFATVRLLMQRIGAGGKFGAMVSGFGLGMTGGSPGKPWRE